MNKQVVGHIVALATPPVSPKNDTLNKIEDRLDAASHALVSAVASWGTARRLGNGNGLYLLRVMNAAASVTEAASALKELEA